MKGILSAVVATAVFMAACGGDGEGDNSTTVDSANLAGGSFGAQVSAASSTYDARMSEIFDPINEEFETMSADVAIRSLADALPQVTVIVGDYIVELESLDVPDEFATDVEIHLNGLREVLANFELQQAAAAAGSTFRVGELNTERASLQREYTGELSSAYLVYIDTDERDIAFSALFEGTTEAEIQYFDGVEAAWAEFTRRNDQAQQSLSGTYSTAEDFLDAISAAGAGTAFAAVYDLAEQLEPPPRFVEDHARFLAYLKETVELDRTIADAARTGDVVGFEVANFGLALAASGAATEVSPTFAAVGFPGSPQTVLAATYERDDDFGLRLHSALRTLAIRFDPSGMYSFLPQTTDEQVMAAVPEITPPIIDRLEEAHAAVLALEPPPELVADHKIIVVYLDDLIRAHRSIISAADAGVATSMETAMSEIEPLFDQASSGLSEAIRPAVAVYFSTE